MFKFVLSLSKISIRLIPTNTDERHPTPTGSVELHR